MMSRKTFGAWLITIMSAFTCAAYLWANYDVERYALLYVLPLTFGGVSSVFFNTFSACKKNIGVLCVTILFYIRMVISPFLMALGGFPSIYLSVSDPHVVSAIGLMAYECVAVFGTMSSILHSKRNSKTQELKLHKPHEVFRGITFCMVVFALSIWLALPQSRSLYKTIFSSGDIAFTTVSYSVSEETVGSLTRALLTLFKMVFDLLRLVLPMYALIMVYEKNQTSKWGVVLGFLFAFTQLLFITSTTARAVVSAFIVIYFTSRLFEKYSRVITKIAICGSICVVVLYFTVRFYVGSRYGENIIVYVSNILNAYFSGVENVAAGLNTQPGHEFSTFFGSLYAAIPFNSSLFGLKVEKFQSLFNEWNHSYGQIPPMVTEGYYYFGAIFAPMMSCVCARFAVNYGSRYANTTSPWHLVPNLFIAIMSAVAIVMYNEEIILVWLTEWLIPMKILAKIADKEWRLVKYENRGNNVT